MKKYNVSIQTDYESVYVFSSDIKREALKQAAYYRTGGLSYRHVYRDRENPMVCVSVEGGDGWIYCKDFFKYALKK